MGWTAHSFNQSCGPIRVGQVDGQPDKLKPFWQLSYVIELHLTLISCLLNVHKACYKFNFQQERTDFLNLSLGLAMDNLSSVDLPRCDFLLA